MIRKINIENKNHSKQKKFMKAYAIVRKKQINLMPYSVLKKVYDRGLVARVTP